MRLHVHIKFFVLSACSKSLAKIPVAIQKAGNRGGEDEWLFLKDLHNEFLGRKLKEEEEARHLPLGEIKAINRYDG